MKKLNSLPMVLAAGAAFAMMGGCANIGLAPDRMEVVDYQKMDLINDYAKRTGMTVIWVRQPTRTVDKVAIAGS